MSPSSHPSTIQAPPSPPLDIKASIPAGSVVPTGKDNSIVSTGSTKVIPAGRTILFLQLQQYHTTTVSNNNAKFPYLKKEEYETWAMKMEYWIMNKHIVVQREIKARTILLQSLLEDHMADFYHLDDARDIWLAVKARFGGNDESNKMRKSMLKQEFSEFR
ncbi:hypothetical protein Tco_1520450, partial [Tanacetum coccineum]